MKKRFSRQYLILTSGLRVDSSFNIKQQSLKKNLFFQVTYQIIILLIPLLTAGYVTRTLGDTNLGNYSYVNSIAYYFIVFSMLGISTYGQRTIASAKSNNNELRKQFWSLFYVHLVSSIIAIVAYLLFVTFFVKENQLMYYIESFFVLSALFDITWLFSGLENFQSVVIKNLFIKISSVICLFAFVHSKDDILVYIWISSLSTFLGNLLLWPQALRAVKPIKVTFKDCLCHLKPILLFFSIAVGVALYTVFDKTLLGIFDTKEDVAYYDYADKIIQIPKGIMGAITTVMMPRSCALATENNTNEAKKYIRYSMMIISLLGFGSMFGLLAIGQNLTIVYYGDEFAKSGDMLLWMSPLPYIVCMGSVFLQQYMIPQKMDKAYTIIIFANSMINLILSCAFLSVLGAYGVILGTLAAELFGMIVELCVSKKVVSFKDVLISGLPFILIGFLMYCLIELLQECFSLSLGHLVLIIAIGFSFYLILSMFYIFFLDRDKKDYRAIFNRILIRFHIKKALMKDDTITSHNKTGGGQSLLDKPVFKAKEKSYCNKDSRNVTIDILRVLGILLIVLAHINASTGVNAPPPLLFNFRTFDVPMMVFISALSFYSNKPINTWRDYFKYVQKRFVRLVIPTFIFLTFYFLFEWALSSWVPTEDLNLKTMFLSYSMISGIGYVWIIRIFLCEALLAPFLRHGAFLIKEKLWLQILIISASLLIEFGMCYFCNHYLSGKLLTLIGVIFVPIFGYAIIYFFGLLFKQSKTIWQIILIVFCGTALIGVCFVEDIYSIATYKYPPDLIYILYGTTISATLYFILNLIFNNSKNLKILTWLSSNSMDVYYSHIIVLYFYNNSLISSYSWWADYLIVVSISILAVVAKKAFDNHVRPKIARLYGAN